MNHTSALLAAGVMLALGGCKGESPEHKAAAALDAQVDSLIAAGQYRQAVVIIDSLNRTYPKEIEIRKGTNLKRSKAFEGLATTQIPVLEARIDSLRQAIDAMEPDFKIMKPSAALPGYGVYKTAAGTDFMAAPTVQARVNTDIHDAADTHWTLSVNAGRNIGLQSVSVSLSNGGTYDMKVVSADGQTGTVSPEAATPLAEAITDGATATVTAMGSNGKAVFKLSSAQLTAIAQSCRFAGDKAALRAALIDRERVDRMLQIARDQSANAATAPDAAGADAAK